jgi:hypothetical protein
LLLLAVVMVAGTAGNASAVGMCSVASSAVISFGAIPALASTGDITANSGTTLWVNCTSDVTSTPSLYSATPRTLTSSWGSLPFNLSIVSPTGAELASAPPGTLLSITRNGSNQVVTLHGMVSAYDFRSLPSGNYSRVLALTVEY